MRSLDRRRTLPLYPGFHGFRAVSQQDLPDGTLDDRASPELSAFARDTENKSVRSRNRARLPAPNSLKRDVQD